MLRGFGVLVLTFAVGAGCARPRIHKSAWLVTEADAGRYVQTALEHPNADERRDAIAQLSKTRFADHEAVVDACGLVARTDTSASVRTAAIRVVAESLRPDAAKTLLRMFEADRVAIAEMERVHVESLNGLYFLALNGAVGDGDDEAVTDLARQVLREDTSRDMKIAAARLLGRFPRLDGVNALIGALEHEDFGVVYHAERSLNELTGVRHQHDAAAWRAWVRSTDDHFAGRGRLDETAVVEANWWQRVWGN